MSATRLFHSDAYAVERVDYHPGRTMPRHTDGVAGLSVVLAGRLAETVGRTEEQGGALSVVVKPAEVAHSNRFGPEGARLLSVRFARGFGEEGSPDDLLRTWRWDHTGSTAPVVFGLWRSVHASPEAHALGALDDALARLLDAFQEDAKGSARPPSWLRDVRDRLHDEHAAPPSAADLAARAGVHRVHLARCFRRHVGCSMTAYLQRLRVRTAAGALAGSDEPMAGVALEAGFSDQSHLCRTFKTATGLTPGAYRRLARA